MDEEMSFPNPVVRNDLPVKKPKWPRIVGAVAILLLLLVVFLPQILNTHLGRTIVKQYLGGKFNAEVSMLDFHTSWFGGTSAVEVWIKNTDGHVLGCHQIQTEASLFKLLRGKYDLGNCTVVNFGVDWVIDYADMMHLDTYNRLVNRAPTAPGAVPPSGLPVSGNITLRGGTVNVLRGTVVPGTLQTTYQMMRFGYISGTLSAKTASDPWQCDLTAKVGDDKSQPGTISIKGTVGFGGAGVLSADVLGMSLKVDGANIPAASCVPYLPLLSADDARQAIGATIDSFKLDMQSDAGKLNFAAFDAVGSRAQIHLRPVIDLKPWPAVLTLAAPGSVTIGIPGGELRRALSAIDPFLASAGGEGVSILRLDTLAVPLDRRGFRMLSASGELELHEVKLATLRTAADGQPVGLVAQLSLLTGSPNLSPILNAGPTRFKIEGGAVNLTPGQLTVDDALLSIAGAGASDGSLKMAVSLNSAPRLTAAVSELATASGPAILVPLVGTVDEPKLDLEAARRTLSAEALPKFDAYLAAQLAQFKLRQAEAAKRPQESAVENLIQGFRPTTKPSP